MIGLAQRRAVRLLGSLGSLALLIGLPVSQAGADPGPSPEARIHAPFSDRTILAASGASNARAARQRRRPDPAFAGYLTTRTGRASVQARLNVPRYHCTGKEQAISPGVFLLSGPVDHEYFSAANIILGCYKGRKVSEEALVVNNMEKNSLRRMYSGDTIMVRVTDSPGGSMTLRVKDLTPAHRFTVQLSGQGAVGQAELVGDWASVDTATGAAVAPPRFAPTTFTAARIDGAALGSLKPAVYEMARSQKLQISTSRVSGTPRDTFTCRRR